jgi:serine/threonine protein kinase
MLTTDGQAKVTDFGLTRAAITPTDQPAAGTTVLAPSGGYTPAYAAPEQLEAATTLTRRADVYSLAMTVLTMLTGGCDWELSLVGAGRLDQLADGTRTSPAGELPAGLTALLGRCLARDPADRPHDLTQVADELARIYQQHTNRPYPHARPEPAEMLAASLNNKALSLLDLGQAEQPNRPGSKPSPSTRPTPNRSTTSPWPAGAPPAPTTSPPSTPSQRSARPAPTNGSPTTSSPTSTSNATTVMDALAELDALPATDEERGRDAEARRRAESLLTDALSSRRLPSSIPTASRR